MTTSLDIKRYSNTRKTEWNDLILNSKNGTFLFHRDYMDYHQDRFTDHSLMIESSNKVVAVFVANESDQIIQSHGGLSYGGLIYTTKLRTKDVLEILEAIIAYYKGKGFKELYYKSVPEIYHSYPSAEDRYALFKKGAELYRRDVSSTIDLDNKLKLSKGRKWLLARAKKNNITVQESQDFEGFFSHYNTYLKNRYGVGAVHNVEEMKLLRSRFPENIKYISASIDDEFLGGTILYCTPKVIHAQYIHFSEQGKEVGAFDLTMSKILEEYQDRKYFDFGISTEQDGQYLNEGLISFKESFGARATLCDFYKIKL
ncbi:MAG: GNAT family N-acetyltransferase [Flavobacteriaceae bacterium]